MTQFPTLQRLRFLFRIEVAVLLAILAVAVVWYREYQQIEEAQNEETKLDQQVRAVRADVNLMGANDQRTALEEEKKLLQAEQNPFSLPFREDALAFRNEFLAYVDEQQLTLSVFSKEDTLAFLPSPGDGGEDQQEQEFPIVRYSIVAQGGEDSLVGVLQLLQDFPTSNVQRLELFRPEGSRTNWEMILDLDILYQTEGA